MVTEAPVDHFDTRPGRDSVIIYLWPNSGLRAVHRSHAVNYLLVQQRTRSHGASTISCSDLAMKSFGRAVGLSSGIDHHLAIDGVSVNKCFCTIYR